MLSSDNVLSVFIGYDSREHDAYQVAKSSLLKLATGPIHIQPLDERALRHAGLYCRNWSTEADRKIDATDHKPFSTEFSFTRFLVPSLCQWDGWAIFVDCDFLFLADLSKLPATFDDKYAVMLCKQNYAPKTDIKMDGQVQTKYNRKNWSSFMAFNCGHPSNKLLTPDRCNKEYGSWLHGFGWLRDDEIGDLDHRWNWLAGTTTGKPLAVHYSEGGPWFKNYRNCAYAQEWLNEARLLGLKIEVEEQAA